MRLKRIRMNDRLEVTHNRHPMYGKVGRVTNIQRDNNRVELTFTGLLHTDIYILNPGQLNPCDDGFDDTDAAFRLRNYL